MICWHGNGFLSGCLVCPNRGGHSRNLTTLVVQQIQRYDSGAKNEPKTTGGGKRNRKQKIGDEAVAKRASAKLEDGDIKGTLRVLTSNDSLAPYKQDTVDLLTMLHPTRPTDSRPFPHQTSAPLRVSTHMVKTGHYEIS